jgi:hypothetical protein
MRKISLLLLLAVFVGCKGTTGPLASRQREQKPDPLLNSTEQQNQFVRERYPLMDDDSRVLPNTNSERPGVFGR